MESAVTRFLAQQRESRVFTFDIQEFNSRFREEYGVDTDHFWTTVRNTVPALELQVPEQPHDVLADDTTLEEHRNYYMTALLPFFPRDICNIVSTIIVQDRPYHEDPEVGDLVSCEDFNKNRYASIVLDKSPDKGEVLIHYFGWTQKWREWVPIGERIRLFNISELYGDAVFKQQTIFCDLDRHFEVVKVGDLVMAEDYDSLAKGGQVVLVTPDACMLSLKRKVHIVSMEHPFRILPLCDNDVECPQCSSKFGSPGYFCTRCGVLRYSQTHTTTMTQGAVIAFLRSRCSVKTSSDNDLDHKKWPTCIKCRRAFVRMLARSGSALLSDLVRHTGASDR